MFESRQEVIEYVKKKHSAAFIGTKEEVEILINKLTEFNLIEKIIVNSKCIWKRKDAGTIGCRYGANDYINYVIEDYPKVYYTKIICKAGIKKSNINKNLPDNLAKTDYNYELYILPGVGRGYIEYVFALSYLFNNSIILPNNVTLEIFCSELTDYAFYYSAVKYIILNYLNGNTHITINGKWPPNYTKDGIDIVINKIIEEYNEQGDSISLLALNNIIENNQLKGITIEKVV